MAQRYAKDQPAGFSNQIKRVAIVGAAGQLGKFITAELLKTGKHEVTALTREGSNATLPHEVKSIPVNYDDPETLVAALKDQQFLIITLSVFAPPDTQPKLVAAAAKAGVRYIVPNFWGTDIGNATLMRETPLGSPSGTISDHFGAPEAQGTSWIGIVCSLWYEYSLAMGPIWFGFDFGRKVLTLYDDGETKINVTTWEQCARATAALVSLKELPEDEGDESPNVSRWRNKPLYISSFLISQKHMFESWKRISGDTDEDWTIERENSEQRYKRGIKQMEEGNDPMAQRMGAAQASFVRTFFPDGAGDYESKRGLANDLLGLPKEDLDERTKVAKQMVEEEYAAELFASRMT